MPKSSRSQHLLAFALGALLLGSCAQESASPQSETEGPDSLLKERAAILDPRSEGIGELVADLSTTGLDGETRTLSEIAGKKPLVLLLRDVGCPVSKRMGPDTAELEASYADEPVVFLYLNVSPHNTPEEMRGEIEQFGFRGRYVHDPEGKIAQTLGAKTTTETFLLDAARTLVYRGALDDRVGRGVVREAAQHRYLANAIDATLAGEPVRTSATSAPGCFLEWETEWTGASEPTLTYHNRISRILQQNCVACHRTGGAAPFPLETYEQVKGRRGMVKFTVAEGIMPPWYATDTGGPWENDRRLSERDKRDLLDWYAQGAPEGDAKDAPRPRDWPEG